ncbi:MAG: MFS transporter [Anaerolineales bacterium]
MPQSTPPPDLPEIQPQTSESTPPAGYLQLTRTNASFRDLWFGQIISLLGDWFNLIASAALVGQLTGSGLAIGGLFVVRMLAPFLISPLGGVLADRYNRKVVLILSDLSRALVVLGFLLVRSAGDVWMLYLLTAVQLAITGVFFPTRNAILPDIVSRSELGTANTLTSVTWSIMLAVGAALGGLVAGGWGFKPAFIVDSLSFLLSAFFISRVKYTHHPREEAVDLRPQAVMGEYLDGLRYLGAHPAILLVALHKAAISLMSNGAYQVIQVRIAERVFVLGEGGGISLGLLYTAAGIGTGLGPVLARRLTGDRKRPMALAIALGYGITAAGLLWSAPLWSLGMVLLGNALRSFGGGINWVFSTQLLFQLTPDRVRGRIFSTEFAMFTLASAIGAAAGGWALDDSGLSLGGLLGVLGVLTFLPGLLWGGWLRRHGRSLE